MEANWADLSPMEKREKRFEKWLSTEGMTFNSPEAEQKYKDIVTRLTKVIKLEEPDRVPVMLPTGTLPIYMAGMTYKEAMYDNEKLCKAYMDVLHVFKGDSFAGPMIFSGKASEIIDSKISKYPGHGLPDFRRRHRASIRYRKNPVGNRIYRPEQFHGGPAAGRHPGFGFRTLPRINSDPV